MTTEHKDNNKILDVEGERLKEEIEPRLYDELMANLNQDQQMQILRGIQSYLNDSNEIEKQTKINILTTLTPKEGETSKTYVGRMEKFFNNPKSILRGGRKKKKRKTQKKRKQKKRRRTYKKRKSSRSRKKKSRRRRRR